MEPPVEEPPAELADPPDPEQQMWVNVGHAFDVASMIFGFIPFCPVCQGFALATALISFFAYLQAHMPVEAMKALGGAVIGMIGGAAARNMLKASPDKIITDVVQPWMFKYGKKFVDDVVQLRNYLRESTVIPQAIRTTMNATIDLVATMIVTVYNLAVPPQASLEPPALEGS